MKGVEEKKQVKLSDFEIASLLKFDAMRQDSFGDSKASKEDFSLACQIIRSDIKEIKYKVSFLLYLISALIGSLSVIVFCRFFS